MRAAGVALAVLAGACGQMGGEGRVCRGPAPEVLAEALGSAAERADSGEAACRWTAQPGADGIGRSIEATLWREGRLRAERTTAPLFFERQLFALEKDFAHVRILGGVGDAAVFGMRDLADETFAGAILVRQDGDVLLVKITGADPAAFEAATRDMASRL